MDIVAVLTVIDGCGNLTSKSNNIIFDGVIGR